MKRYGLCITFIVYLNMIAIEQPYQAVVVTPVADLVGKPLLARKHADVYHLPISGVGTNGCSRIHQLIFNETVTVIEEQGSEIRVRISNVFFETAHNATRFTEYWTHKHAIVSHDTLAKQKISLTHFPRPIDFKKDAPSSQNIVTLISPYHDKRTQQTYSAGTRFVVHTIKNNNFVVYAYSPSHHTMYTIPLPQYVCLQEKHRTQKHKITLFTSLVKQWARQQYGFIPYVLGGCSFTAICRTNHFLKKETAYYRPTYPNVPASGLDCTGIIARAAQICGIPYHFKNTTTVVKYLRPIKQHEAIENGDIIWFAGHAIIIADMSNNVCVEARSYDHGFGKIHAITVNKLFANMQTIQDIKTAMHTHKPVTRLNSSGEKIQIIPSIKILKLSSVWQH